MKNKTIYVTKSNIKEVEEHTYYDWNDFVDNVNKSIYSDIEVLIYPFNENTYKLQTLYMDGATRGTIYFTVIEETSDKISDKMLAYFYI